MLEQLSRSPMERTLHIDAQLVDVVAGTIAPSRVQVVDGRIQSITRKSAADVRGYLLPPFVDAHIHIESSMLLPSQFARVAVVHGTVASVSDPHEIANVCGVEGVELMLADAAQSCFKFCFGAPSCVPATSFETAGAELDVAAVAELLDDPRIGYLSEMMNFPGVLQRNPEVMAKIAASLSRGKPVDGHAPAMVGPDVRSYFGAGITTDHECVSLGEAIEKIAVGCKIAIREGSAARNFVALEPLLDLFPHHCMLCSDDKHPDELLEGHIDQLVRRALRAGRGLMNTLRAASLNPVRHYGLPVGLLQVGDPADFLRVDNLHDVRVIETYIEGACVAREGRSLLPAPVPRTINHFAARSMEASQFQLPAATERIRVIEAIDGSLLTRASEMAARIDSQGFAISDPARDVLKLVVVNRYQSVPPAVAFVRGFGLRCGSLASSVAHDSHNVVAVGVTDEAICRAVNNVIASQGGLAVVGDQFEATLPLPVAGLMSTDQCEIVGPAYAKLDAAAKDLGSHLRAPLMTLSFLALLVIPSLKLSDRGLFDTERFALVPLFV